MPKNEPPRCKQEGFLRGIAPKGGGLLPKSNKEAINSGMKPILLQEIVIACKGTFRGDRGALTQPVKGITTDSRKVGEDFCFIPLKGKNFDGHDFIRSAFAMKALCCLSEKETGDEKPIIMVASCRQALKDIAEYYRSLFDVKVIAVTGSVGKTTTKEMIASVLSQKYNVLKTQGNLNNEIGLPLTLFNLRDEHDIAILEMGMNHFGEIRSLSKTARPDVAVITNIGVSHIENLGSREGILKAKTEVFDFMPAGADVILNGDDDLLATIFCESFRVIKVGMDQMNDPAVSSGETFAEPLQEADGHSRNQINSITAGNITELGFRGTNCTFHIGDEKFDVHIPSLGKHMIYNALFAAAAGKIFLLSHEEIAAGIAETMPVHNRMNVVKTENFTVIDDVYNASPTSLQAAIDVLKNAPGRKVCILGDMFELGENAASYHYEAGQYAARQEIDVIICAGGLAKHYYEGVVENNNRSVVTAFHNQDELLNAINSLIQKGDTILVKASRGMHFEKIVDALLKADFGL